jgi:hypothetical protein
VVVEVVVVGCVVVVVVEVVVVGCVVVVVGQGAGRGMYPVKRAWAVPYGQSPFCHGPVA